MRYIIKYLKYFFRLICSFFWDIIYYIFSNPTKRIIFSNYKNYRFSKLYPDYLKEGGAVECIKYLAKKYCRGKGVDIGAGKFPFENARPIEDNPDENAYNILEPDESLDFVFSSHCLEHLDRPFDALEHWLKKLKPGGCLLLYLPHPACRMWRSENFKFHKWNPDPFILEEWFNSRENCNIEYITYLPDAYFSFVVVVKKK